MTRKIDGWHPEDIKAALRKRFGSACDLSERWGLDRSAISAALRRRDNSKRVERRIAEALGVPLHELWPDRWNADGTPLRFSVAANPSGAGSAAERQKKAAA